MAATPEDMPNEPLAEDTIFHGVIYLKGETNHPIELVQAIAKRDGIVNPTRNVFFQSPASPTPQPAFQPPPAPVVDDTTPDGEEMLPLDMPHRDLFIAAGITTMEELTELGDLTQISGVGTSRAMEVVGFLQNR